MPVSGPVRKFELDTAGLQVGGQRHQLGGVAGEALELVDGDDHLGLGRGLLELVGQRERILQLRPDLDPGTDLLLEDLVALCSAKRFELVPQFLPGGRRPRVSDPHRPLGPRCRATASAGHCFHARPGPRSAGTGTSSSSRSAGTKPKRAVWYYAAVFPLRVRHRHYRRVHRSSGSRDVRPPSRPDRASSHAHSLAELSRTRIQF